MIYCRNNLFCKDNDALIYQDSRKNLIAFALSAIKKKGLNKQGKNEWVGDLNRINSMKTLISRLSFFIRLMKILVIFVSAKK